MNGIKTCTPFRHVLDRPNWQDWGARWARRNAFMKYLKSVLEELEVAYVMPPVPVVGGGKGIGRKQ